MRRASSALKAAYGESSRVPLPIDAIAVSPKRVRIGPGSDDDDVDAEPTDLEAERVAQRLHRVLGGMIEGATWKRQPSAHGAEVHDLAPALAAHAGQHELREPRQAEDVRLELAAHLLHRHELEGRLLAIARDR